LQSGRRIKMATNINGHLVDDKGNVVVDFVWGNFPLQPNDARNVTPVNSGNTYPSGLLNYALDNHVIAESGWNGYPLYTPNTTGEVQSGTAYVLLANYLGLTIADATTAIAEAECVISNTANATNTAKSITRINVTSTTSATVYASGADTAYLVGSQVTIGAGTGIPTALVGSWVVTGSASGNIVIKGTGWTVADTGTIAPAASLTGKSGTIKTQSPVAGADNVAIGATVTTTSWA
jgi:hypothetical protein